MIRLFISMMEWAGLVISLVFLLVNVPYLKRVSLSHEKVSSKAQLILIFGSFTIISNFTGIEITKNQIAPNNSLTYLSSNASTANTRTLVIGVPGLVDNPIVGSTVGLVADFHRVIQGGGHGLFYVPASLIAGLIVGFLESRMAKRTVFPSAGFSATVGACMEMTQMIFVFFFSGDLVDGITLVCSIMLLAILLNNVGTFIFMSILTTTLKQERRAKTVQAHDVLELAAETLPYF